MVKNNNKAFALLPMVLWISFLIVIIFFFIKSKEASIWKINSSLTQWIISDVESARGDLMIRIDEGKQITNPKLQVLWKEIYDDGSINEYNTIEAVLGWTNDSLSNSDKIQFIDRVITHRRKKLEFINSSDSPDKANNVFELDLVNFLDNNQINQGRLGESTLSYGTKASNTPDVYILLWRIKTLK